MAHSTCMVGRLTDGVRTTKPLHMTLIAAGTSFLGGGEGGAEEGADPGNEPALVRTISGEARAQWNEC